jgi:hypothetical protein
VKILFPGEFGVCKKFHMTIKTKMLEVHIIGWFLYVNIFLIFFGSMAEVNLLYRMPAGEC